MRWTVHLEGGPRRVNHAAVCVGEYIFSFGGYCTGDDYRFSESIDVHVLNIQTLRWTLLPQRRDENGTILKYPEVPFQRYGHTAVAHKDKIYIWGGRNDESLCNVLYCFDPKTLSWSRPPVIGAIPGARDGHSACVIDNSPSFRDFHTAEHIHGRMYIFGGRGDKHSPYHSQEEIYCPEIVYLDLKTKVWHRPSTTGKVPVGRRSHSMFIYNNLIYVFGGYNGLLDQHFNDLYTFDPKANCWNLVKPHGKPPTPRRRQVGIVKNQRLFLFGGTSPYPHATAQEQQAFLIDNNDTNVLDFEPSLKTLSILAVVEHRIDTTWLPRELRLEIKAMTQPNSISRPINHAG
uniref:Kelch domain-containing protein 3 n=1 Tax=Stomoxys calcitrans TaxID=35570 RepID=A0A1I8QD52_STOCA